MTIEDNSPWFFPIPKSTVEKTLNPIAEPLGKGVGGLVSIMMNPLMKLGVISEHNMDKFEKKIIEKNNNIPLKNRDSSKQGLALKAVEDSIYQLDSEVLQDMFASLISSSLDDRKNPDVLPSFSSILKDLSSEDALLLRDLYEFNAVATADIKLFHSSKRTVLPCLDNILLFDDGSMKHLPTSVETLNRLGLVSIHKTSLVQPNFTNNYRQFRDVNNIYHDYANKQIERFKGDSTSFDTFNIDEGYITMTKLGQQFGKVVIN